MSWEFAALLTRQDLHRLQRRRWQAVRHRGSVLRVGRRLHHAVVVCAVVGAVEYPELWLAGVGSGGPERLMTVS